MEFRLSLPLGRERLQSIACSNIAQMMAYYHNSRTLGQVLTRSHMKTVRLPLGPLCGPSLRGRSSHKPNSRLLHSGSGVEAAW